MRGEDERRGDEMMGKWVRKCVKKIWKEGRVVRV